MTAFRLFLVLCLSNYSSAANRVSSVCVDVLFELQEGTRSRQTIRDLFIEPTQPTEVSGGLESVPSATRGHTIESPERQEVVREVLDVHRKAFTLVYGTEYRETDLPTPRDRITLESRLALRLASLDPNFRVPRELLERIQNRNRELNDAIQAKENELALIAEDMGENFRLWRDAQAEQVLAQFGQQLRMMGPNSTLYEPLTRFLVETNGFLLDIYVSKVSVGQEHMRLQRFLVDLGEHIGRDRMERLGLLRVLDEVLTINFNHDPFPLSAESHATLEAYIDGAPGGSVAFTNRLRGICSDVVKAENMLERFRQHYAENKDANDLIWQFLSSIARPDGRPSLDSGNIMLDATPRDLSDSPLLREIVMTALANSQRFLHPRLTGTFEFDGSIQDAMQQFGFQVIDPFIVRQFSNYHRDHEAARARLYSLNRTINYNREIQGEREWSRIHARVNAAARATVSTVLRSHMASTLPQAVRDVFLQQLQVDNVVALTENERALNSYVVPNNIHTFIHQRTPVSTVQTPWRADALVWTRDISVERDLSPGEAATYFAGILQTLEARAAEIWTRDTTRTETLLNSRTLGNDVDLIQIREEIRQLIVAVSQVSHQLDECYEANLNRRDTLPSSVSTPRPLDQPAPNDPVAPPPPGSNPLGTPPVPLPAPITQMMSQVPAQPTPRAQTTARSGSTDRSAAEISSDLVLAWRISQIAPTVARFINSYSDIPSLEGVKRNLIMIINRPRFGSSQDVRSVGRNEDERTTTAPSRFTRRHVLGTLGTLALLAGGAGVSQYLWPYWFLPGNTPATDDDERRRRDQQVVPPTPPIQDPNRVVLPPDPNRVVPPPNPDLAIPPPPPLPGPVPAPNPDPDPLPPIPDP